MAVNQIGICKLCNQERKLIKAHIIPKAFYKDIKKKKGYIALEQDGHRKKYQKGIYDNNILCAECDNSKLAPIEKEAAELLLQHIKYYVFYENFYQRIYYISKSNFNYEILRKFFILILWRASISNKQEYRDFTLNEYEKVAKEIILGEKDYPNLFNFFIYKIPDNVKYSNIMYLTYSLPFGIKAVELQMGAYNVTITLNVTPLDYLKLISSPYNVCNQNKMIIEENVFITNRIISMFRNFCQNIKKGA